jgi:hypothetical protein
MEWKNQFESCGAAREPEKGFMSEALKPDDELPRSPHHVLDELKSVLSSLGHSAEPAAPVEPIPEAAPLRDTPPSSPAKSPPPASDADFWSGNVLGWPSGTEAMKKDPLPEPMPVVPPPVLPTPEPIFATPEPILPTPEPIFRAPPPVHLPEPVPTSPPPADRPPWPADDILPEPPPAPASPVKLDPVFNQAPVPMPRPVPSPDLSMEPPAIASHPNPFTDAFPLPRNIDERAPRPVMTENPLLQTEPVAKPKDLIQLACFFPEGNDKVGQQFAKQLRDAGMQRVPALIIEPVLISSWSTRNIDMNAWTKSAQLSGADVMFVLVPRHEIKLFQSKPAMGFQPPVITRIVAMENVSLRTLYADIMIELKRKV